MSLSLGSSSRTLTTGGDNDETHDSLAPLTNVPLPRFNSRNLGPFDGEIDLMGSSGVLPEVGENLCEESLLSSSSKLNSDLSKSTLKLFSSNTSFNSPSKYANALLDLEALSEYCDFDGGYSIFPPLESDRMWTFVKPGRHAIPDLFFEYGFRLPMHPFYVTVLDTFCCGIGQLAPNAILQINGLIARCHELNEYPSMDLLFSVYRIKSNGIQIYFDKKSGRTKLVNAPASNSGWHPGWAWYEGGELSRIGPWRRVSTSRVKTLNRLGSVSTEKLKAFHGSSVRYAPESFSDVEFLSSHCCKA